MAKVGSTYHSRSLRIIWVFVLAAVLAACGGDDNEGDAAADSSPSADSAEDGSVVEDATPGGAPGGSVDGSLVSVLTFDFGLWALDPLGGEPFEVTVPDVGFADRQKMPLMTPDGSTAVMTVFTALDGQSFSNDVGLGAIDLGTGEGRLLTALGQDRTDDESSDFSSWELIALSDDTAWVVESASGVEGEALLAVDLATGALSTAVEASESRVRSAAVLDGVLFAEIDGSISRLGTAGWDQIVAFGDLGFDQFLTPTTMATYAITRSGTPLAEDWAASMLTFFEVRPTISGIVAAGSSLYWQFNENWSNVDGTDNAIVGGFIQFDPVSAQITAAWPVGPSVGAFTGENEITTSSQGTWHATGDIVWFADARDDGALLRLDPAAGVETFRFDPVPGADYTRIELLPNDPDGVWLILEDWTITESNESGTSATGDTRFVLVDPGTGGLALEIDESDLIGF